MLALLLIASLSAPDRLQCAVRGDRIEITLPASMDPSIRSMALVRGKRWLTLVDETHHLAPFRPGAKRLVLRRSDQKAAFYGADGQEKHVRAFGTPGAYRIVFTDNLETEPENMTMRDCVVRLR